jgi:uncharacterized membrane protein
MQNLNILAFTNESQAFQVRDALVKLENEGLGELIDAVIITRNTEGKVKLHQSMSGTAAFAAAGSLAGMIMGALVLSPVFGSMVGTASGAAIGLLVDLGISDRFMKDLGATLIPGSSALCLLGSKGQLEEIGKRLGALLRDCTILQTTVNKDREDEIRRILEAS